MGEGWDIQGPSPGVDPSGVASDIPRNIFHNKGWMKFPGGSRIRSRAKGGSPMAARRNLLHIEKPISHHLEDWDVLGIMTRRDVEGEKKPEEPRKTEKKVRPHHLDEADIFSGMTH
jgi:hypothetical protein